MLITLTCGSRAPVHAGRLCTASAAGRPASSAQRQLHVHITAAAVFDQQVRAVDARAHILVQARCLF
jgi:hypothetical protein